MFKIATWNINSLRVRLPQLLDWLKRTTPDIVALQETKITDDKFPLEAIQTAGYHALFSGQNTYNGVALLSRVEGHQVITDLPHLDDPQRRLLGATYNTLRVLNIYVPNGAALDSEKYYYKLDWLKHLQNYVRESLKQVPRLIILGDFNIAPKDCDVHNPAAYEGRILVSPPERTALEDLLKLGLHDTFRLFDQVPESFSWWDYRRGAFRRNQGMRLDFILTNTLLSPHCTACMIDIAQRRLERPSDHAPVIAHFDI